MARGRTNAFWIVPTVTFLAGLVLGGVLVGVSNLGRDDDAPAAAAAGPTPSPGASGSQDVTVVVPRSCVEAAERSEQVLALTREAAEALSELDARRLADVVDEMRGLQAVVGDAAASCRDAAVTNATTGAAPTPTVSVATPEPGSPPGQDPAGVIRPSPSTG